MTLNRLRHADEPVANLAGVVAGVRGALGRALNVQTAIVAGGGAVPTMALAIGWNPEPR
jgi:hypothetical protein